MSELVDTASGHREERLQAAEVLREQLRLRGGFDIVTDARDVA